MKIDIYGAKGHAKVIVELLEEIEYKVKNIYDDDVSILSLFNHSVIHEFTMSSNLVISIGDNEIRKKLVDKLNVKHYPTLIHPKTSISKRSKIGDGTVVMAGVSINSAVQVGKHCIINTNCSLDHECIIGDYTHISPNVALAGNVVVGEGTHVGIGASVIPGIKIGKWCTIGAGAVIIKDIPDGATVVGNPGRIIKIKDL